MIVAATTYEARTTMTETQAVTPKSYPRRPRGATVNHKRLPVLHLRALPVRGGGPSPLLVSQSDKGANVHNLWTDTPFAPPVCPRFVDRSPRFVDKSYPTELPHNVSAPCLRAQEGNCNKRVGADGLIAGVLS